MVLGLNEVSMSLRAVSTCGGMAGRTRMAPCMTKPGAFCHQVSVSAVERLNNSGFYVIVCIYMIYLYVYMDGCCAVLFPLPTPCDSYHPIWPLYSGNDLILIPALCICFACGIRLACARAWCGPRPLGVRTSGRSGTPGHRPRHQVGPSASSLYKHV
jgi:hypothetical protein